MNTHPTSIDMGIGDRYVYTMEGTGRKPHIHRHFRKFIASSFFDVFEHVATTHPTNKTDLRLEIG